MRTITVLLALAAPATAALAAAPKPAPAPATKPAAPAAAAAPRPAPAPAVAEAESAEEPAAPAGQLQRSNKIEFDERLVKGQTAKSGAVYLFKRVPRQLPGLVGMRRSYRKRIVAPVLGERELSPWITRSFDKPLSPEPAPAAAPAPSRPVKRQRRN